MAAIPYKPLGIDKNGIAFVADASPIGPAKKQYVSENGTASSVLTLTDNTTVVGITAGGAPAFIKWITTGDTQASVVAVAGSTANYDDVIPANTTRIFPIPMETAGTTSIVGANKANGLYNRMAWKSGGIASILAVEF